MSTCEGCGHESPDFMTVRTLIHALMEVTTNMDAVVVVTTENGGITTSFDLVATDEVDAPSADGPGIVCLLAGDHTSWNSETGALVEAGVLMLDGTDK